jgi:hypothetical protein
MKYFNYVWCVECNELFEEAPVCPSCTNRSNLMPLTAYIGQQKPRRTKTNASRKP